MKGEIELENMIYIFKGHTTKVKGHIPRQVVEPYRINYGSRMIKGRMKTEKQGEILCSFGFDRFLVCDKNSPAGILYGDKNEYK